MAAFRLCVRAASRERRVERELVPKWNRVIRKRLAFKRFAGARVPPQSASLASASRWPPSCGSPRVTRAWFAETRARRAQAARGAREGDVRGAEGAAARRRNLRRVGVGATRRATARRRASILYARNERRRHFALPFAAWRHETIRESEAEAHAAELVARATSTRVYRFAGRRVRRRKIILLHAWRATARERLRLRVAVARARGRWQAARGAQLVRAWHVAKRASKHAKRVLFSRAFGAWEASARERRFAETLAARGARNRARRAFSAALVAWARLAAPRMVANAEARVVAAEAKAAEARSPRTARTVPPRWTARRWLPPPRTESLAGSLASAGAARALAPTGGGLLETPLGWRGVQTANASVVAEMGTSAHLGGAKQTRGGEAATNPDEKSVGVSKPLDPCPPVFIPDRDPYALDATEDGAPSTSGVAVTLLPGGKIVTFAALAVSTPSATTRWDSTPPRSGSPRRRRRLRARRPCARAPRCALPAATAAVAAAAAGADPAGVVGGVFVYGGFDGSAEMSDAHVLLRRIRTPPTRASQIRFPPGSGSAWQKTRALPPPPRGRTRARSRRRRPSPARRRRGTPTRRARACARTCTCSAGTRVESIVATTTKRFRKTPARCVTTCGVWTRRRFVGRAPRRSGTSRARAGTRPSP